MQGTLTLAQGVAVPRRAAAQLTRGSWIMQLEGKVAMVTGASGDIGRAIAIALAEAGADIAGTYVGNVDGSAETRSEVEGRGRHYEAIHLDQRDPASVERAVKDAVTAFGRLDILVNNAAWNIGIPFPDLQALTPEIWDRILETNARGPFLLVRAAAPHLKASGAGRVVNIASVGGLAPGSSSIAYSSSKAALIHLTRCLAVALAPEVTVNCVAPGLVEGTRMALRLPAAVAEGARRRAILGKVSSAQDVALQTRAFCEADTTTGQVLVVDGGTHFH